MEGIDGQTLIQLLRLLSKEGRGQRSVSNAQGQRHSLSWHSSRSALWMKQSNEREVEAQELPLLTSVSPLSLQRTAARC